MERLTIPDELIEGGMRRAIIDTRAVREKAMTVYWRLKAYEDTGLTPEEIMDGKMLTGWIPVVERMPEEDGDYLVTMATPGFNKGQPYTNWLCWDGDDQEWTDTDGDTIPDQDTVIAWKLVPEPWEG